MMVVRKQIRNDDVLIYIKILKYVNHKNITTTVRNEVKLMLLAGIVGGEDKSRTANLIKSIFSAANKKVFVMDSNDYNGLKENEVKLHIGDLSNSKVDLLIMKISFADIYLPVFDFLHFDIMIYNDKADGITESDLKVNNNAIKRAYSLLDENGVVIVNVDDSELIQLLEGMKYCIVTYGFNTKASMTTSSVGDISGENNFLCCLQRSIKSKNGLLFEPQEYKLKIQADGMNAYNVLAAATFAIVNGIDLNEVDQLVTN
jgi:UDP-N-acetylmuramate-alanine ligase